MVAEAVAWEREVVDHGLAKEELERIEGMHRRDHHHHLQSAQVAR